MSLSDGSNGERVPSPFASSSASASATRSRTCGSKRKTNAEPPSGVPVDQISGADATSRDAAETESLVADAPVRILGALSEAAEPLEVPALERAAAVRDQKHRRGFGLQHERDLPGITAGCRSQRVVRVLKQLEYAPSPISLRDLAAEAGDRPVLPAPVLELIQERADLAQRMGDDLPVRALPCRRCINVHAFLSLHSSAVQPALKPHWHRTMAERAQVIRSHFPRGSRLAV